MATKRFTAGEFYNGSDEFSAIAVALKSVNGTVVADGAGGVSALSEGTAYNKDFGTGAGDVCQGNDSRLSDARTPTAHASSHQSGGGDAIKLDDLAAPDDNTDLNATTSAHGLLPKLGGGTTNFLRADGSWAEPAGSGDVSGPASSTDNAFPRFDSTTGKLLQNGQTTEDDSGNVSVAGNITVGGTVDGRDLATDGSKLDGIEAAADVTDATNVAAAGAVMESDTSTALMQFVIDEDDMASDLADKVPTQQSVKAYADSLSGQLPTNSDLATAHDFGYMRYTNSAGVFIVEVVAPTDGGTKAWLEILRQAYTP